MISKIKYSLLPLYSRMARLYFSPEDDNELYTQLKRLNDSNELRQEYIQRGIDRLKFFSWEKCARETLDCYNKAINCKISTLSK